MGWFSSDTTPDKKEIEAQIALQQEADRQKILLGNVANNPDVYSPQGSITSSVAGYYTDPATGQQMPRWRQDVSLTPEQQAIFDFNQIANTNKADTAAHVTKRLREDFGDSMDWSNFTPGGQGVNAADYRVDPSQLRTNLNQQTDLGFGSLGELGGSADYMGKAGDAMWAQAQSRLDPMWERREADTEVKLRNQGLMPGDEAYDRAMNELNMERTDAYDQAMWGAQQATGAEADRMFDIDLGGRSQLAGELGQQGQFGNTANQAMFDAYNTATGQQFNQNLAASGQNFGQATAASDLASRLRQQEITEGMQQRGQNLNESNALLAGTQVAMPTQPNFNTTQGQGTDVNAVNQTVGQQNAAKAQQTMDWVGMGMQGAAMSDRRLKRNIRALGKAGPYNLYSWDYVWGEPGVGVMADEVKLIKPSAVIRMPSGYDAVNYGEL